MNGEIKTRSGTTSHNSGHAATLRPNSPTANFVCPQDIMCNITRVVNLRKFLYSSNIVAYTGGNLMEIRIVEVQPQMVLGMRKKRKYEEIRIMIPKVCQFAVERGFQIQGPPIFVLQLLINMKENINYCHLDGSI